MAARAWRLVFIAATVLVCACATDEAVTLDAMPAADTHSPGDTSSSNLPTCDVVVEPAFCEVDESAIDEWIDGMTLRQKLAQMLVVGLSATPGQVPADTARVVRDIGVGGMLLQPLRALNCCPSDNAVLLNELNALALEQAPAIPLLFALDQEGGTAQAYPSVFGATDGPGNMALGALGDGQATFDAYRIMGAEVRAFGANVAYAPVLDIHPGAAARFMYTKSFHEQTMVVAAHAECAVAGFRSALVVPCIKHFPGGGASVVDPHVGRPLCELSAQTLRDVHIPPFQAAIAAGADMAMIYSVIYTAFDDVYPASLSRRIKVDLLRDELGFEGVISTGALDIAALDGLDLGEDRNVLAVASGSDLLLHVSPGSADAVEAIVETLNDAAQDGRIDEQEVDDHVRRILRIKQKYCLFERPFSEPDEAQAATGTPVHAAAMDAIIASAITVVHNESGLWPLDPDASQEILVVCPQEIVLTDPASGFPNMTGTTLDAEVGKLVDVEAARFNVPVALEPNVSRAVARAADADIVIVATYNAYYDEEQAEMVRQILQHGKPTVVVALDSPFDWLAFPSADTYLALYNFRTSAIRILAETLFGLHEPIGSLPVTLVADDAAF